MSHDARRRRLPEPGLHRVRLRRGRSGAAPVLRRGLARWRRHQVDHAEGALRPGDPAHGRDAERHDQLHRTAGSGHRRVPRQGPVVAGRPRGARRRVDRRQQRRGVRRARPAAARAAGARHGRGQHLLPQRRGPRAGLRVRPAGCLAASCRPSGRTPRPACRSSPSCRRTSPTSPRSPARASTPAPTACRSSTRCSAWSSTPRRCGRSSAGSPAACPGRRSAPWRSAACGRCTRRCPTCRSSGWAASAPAWTRSSSCWRAPARSASARPCSATRAPPCGCSPSCEQALVDRGIERLSDVVGLAHRPPDLHVPEGPDPEGDPEEDA